MSIIVILSCLRLERSWLRESHLGYTEGTWVALAIDTAHGVFYRPIEGPLGYGGTRYFPLFFSLHAAAIRLGFPPLAAGQVLAVCAVGLLLGAVFLFLRRAGAGPLVGLSAAAVALACQPVQMALLTIRGDGLPAALTVIGLALCLGPAVSVAAPLMFVLAFAAKPTSLYGPAAAVFALALAGRRREALRLALATVGGVVCVVAVMSFASDHRVLSVFAASAAGESTWMTLAVAPVSFGRILRRTPEVVLILVLASVWVLIRGRRAVTLEVIAGIACLAVTTAIFVSPATVENHLIDLTVVGVIVVGGIAAQNGRLRRGVLALLLVAGVVATAGALRRFTTVDTILMRSARLAALSAVSGVRRPIFFQQPMLAAHLGEPAYLLDPYLFSVWVGKDRSTLNRLLDDIDRGTFGAVVFEHATPALALGDLPDEASAALMAALARRYQFDSVVEGRAIYRPRR